MEDFLKMLNGVFSIIFVLLIVFLFYGEPDLWDKLHYMAVGDVTSICSK